MSKTLKNLNKSHIIPLLLQYKKYPCLWDPNDKNYKNHENRMRIFKRISHELKLGMTVGQLRTRIKNLRTTYVREVHRTIRCEKQGAVHTPRLAWFDVADSFLRTVIMPPLETDTESDSVLEETEVTIERVEEFDNPFENANVAVENFVFKQEDDYIETLEGTLDTDYVQIKNNGNIAECISQQNSSRSQTSQTIPKLADSRDFAEDEFVTFGRHVANQLRCLPLREAVRSQNFIHNFLTEERLKFLEKKS